MRLIEAEGKRLLKDIGVAVPGLGDSGPFFVKAQVLQGGRGKAGMVRRAETKDDIERVKKEIGAYDFLVEEAVPHVREWFLSIDLDRAVGDWRVNIGEGGMDVSSAKSFPFASFQDEKFGALAKQLMEGMRKHRITSLEINPLAEKGDGSLVALDAKITLEDEASVRQVDLSGDIALILSGGGASLVALDALELAGGKAANYVELSGNPDPELAKQTALQVFSKPGLKAVWVAGSYANFTDIASTVGAVRAAYDEAGLSIPFVVRRDGPRADEAERETRAWAEAKKIPYAFHRANTNLETSAQVLMDLMKNV